MSGAEDTVDTAARAFAAWQKGEATGDYGDFLPLLAGPGEFVRFSHPLTPRGVHDGAEGRARLEELIAGRTATPNRLTFTNVARVDGEDVPHGRTSAFFFDSEGEVAGGFPYRGYNAIALTVAAGRVVGFREYLGDVEPAWFRQEGEPG
jgi:ketosteroid isomerase-like protein